MMAAAPSLIVVVTTAPRIVAVRGRRHPPSDAVPAGARTLVMTPDFMGRVALVTGGSVGIGETTARMFARRGAKVVIADTAEEEGVRTAAAITEAGDDALFVRTDTADADDAARMVATAVDRYGRLDYAFPASRLHPDRHHLVRHRGVQPRSPDLHRLLHGLCGQHRRRHEERAAGLRGCRVDDGCDAIPDLPQRRHSRRHALGANKDEYNIWPLYQVYADPDASMAQTTRKSSPS